MQCKALFPYDVFSAERAETQRRAAVEPRSWSFATARIKHDKLMDEVSWEVPSLKAQRIGGMQVSSGLVSCKPCESEA